MILLEGVGARIQDGAVGMLEFDSVRVDLALCIHFDQLVASIRVQSWVNVESILCTEVLRPMGGSL